MNNVIHYISYKEALEVYHKMIVASGGGFAGVRDESGILATLEFVQNDEYYSTFPKSFPILSSSSAQNIISMMGISV